MDGARVTTMSDIAREVSVAHPTLYRSPCNTIECLNALGKRALYEKFTPIPNHS